MLSSCPPEERLTFTVLFPEPTSLSRSASFVPLIVDTIDMMDAIPMIIPSMVRNERILCEAIPRNASLIFSSMYFTLLQPTP